MSTYHADHNLTSNNSNTTRDGNSGDTRRHFPTLAETVETFLNNGNRNNDRSGGSEHHHQFQALLAALRQQQEENTDAPNIISATSAQAENFANDEDNALAASLQRNPLAASLITQLLSSIDDDDLDTQFAKSVERGVGESFLDTLERVPIKKIKKTETCPICTNDYHSDPYPLIVRLPCNDMHIFDLDCIGPWLKLNKTCPLCRVDVTEKKKIEISDDSEQEQEEEEEDWEMYG